jgi:hypothetical protein
MLASRIWHLTTPTKSQEPLEKMRCMLSVCVCVNGMHKSGTKQATTWHTDLLLGTFTTRTDVTDWTVCRFFLSLSSPLFFFSIFLSQTHKKKTTQNDEENKIKRRRTRNIKFLVLSLPPYYLVLRKLHPTRNSGSSIRVFPPRPRSFLWWFWFHLTSSSNEKKNASHHDVTACV